MTCVARSISTGSTSAKSYRIDSYCETVLPNGFVVRVLTRRVAPHPR